MCLAGYFHPLVSRVLIPSTYLRDRRILRRVLRRLFLLLRLGVIGKKLRGCLRYGVLFLAVADAADVAAKSVLKLLLSPWFSFIL